MKTYFLKYRGTIVVRSVIADSLKEAKQKLANSENAPNSIAYMQQVFKCDYQDMQGELIK